MGKVKRKSPYAGEWKPFFRKLPWLLLIPAFYGIGILAAKYPDITESVYSAPLYPYTANNPPRAWVYNLACAGRINIRMRGVRAYSGGDSARYRVHSQAFFRQTSLCAADELHYGRMRIRVLYVCAVLY